MEIRLRMILAVLHACIAVLARMVVIVHEYSGPVEYIELPYLIVCSLIREAFLSYMTTVILIIAIDRGIATVAWCWQVSSLPFFDKLKFL
ncbi:hypothetical protein PRIPAC_75740, partial [Pristionchus pacificus]|uniref:Uncharacterized protein n=1 Tax=Pristionchus pacificus TaxID=54126 RepID=A0A2A6C1N3_PRIPA